MNALGKITLFTAGALALAGGCGDGSDDDRSRSQPINLTEFGDQLGSNGALVEIKLAEGSLVATEVHVEDDDDDEKIESRVSGFDPLAGTLTLDLGNLTVSYGAATTFRDAGGDKVERAEWESALTAGTRIEARRNLPFAPQAPDDPTFLADDLRIGKNDDEPKLELLLDSDNLTVVSANEGTLHVLGIDIAINSSTQLRDDSGGNGGSPTPSGTASPSPSGTASPSPSGTASPIPSGTASPSPSPTGSASEFEGRVTSVDLGSATMTLESGTVINVTGASFDPDGDLYSLSATNDALMNGKYVRAEGRGSSSSGVVYASVVNVEVDD